MLRYWHERHQPASISVTPSEIRQRRQQKEEIYNDLVAPAAWLRHPDFLGHYIWGRRTREERKVPVWAAKNQPGLSWFSGVVTDLLQPKQIWVTFTWIGHARFFFPLSSTRIVKKPLNFQWRKLRFLTLLSKWCLSLQLTVYYETTMCP